jgi:hypothetical protein
LLSVVSDKPSPKQALVKFLRRKPRGANAPRVLILTQKTSTPDFVKALSQRFQLQAAIGMLRSGAGKKLAALLGVTKFPAVLIMEPVRSATQQQVRAIVLRDRPSYARLEKAINFCIRDFTEAGTVIGEAVTIDIDQGRVAAATVDDDGNAASGDDATNEEEAAKEAQEEEKVVVQGTVTAVASQADFDTQCLSFGGACLLALSSAPSSDDATAAVLQNVANHFAAFRESKPRSVSKHVTVLTIDSSSAPAAFGEQFGIAETSETSVVLLVPRRKRFARFVGVLDATRVIDFATASLTSKSLVKLSAIVPLGDDVAEPSCGSAAASTDGGDSHDDGMCTAPPS